MQIAFPEPDNTIPAGVHICILRGVESHAFALARVGLWELLRVAMPVIAVKLYDQALLGQERINTEFTTDDMLGQINQPQIVEQRMADLFDRSLVSALLGGIHFDQHSPAIGIGVAAVQRAVQHVVSFARRRPAKTTAANLTRIAVFITALPGDLVFQIAEVLPAWLQSAGGNIHRLTTVGTGDLLSGAPRCILASLRTESLTATGGRLESRAADLARLGRMTRPNPFASFGAVAPAIFAAC